ncbi:hypothetical protein CEB3_c19620 [Peptococcaceae bacterium CEB3]|nr:hypothetical protein CEB3_c19620 [Peptococcaceae bacterium CEB3]
MPNEIIPNESESVNSPYGKYENIPDELKALPQWVFWKKGTRDGETTKVPYSSAGKKAKINDPTTWKGFAQRVYYLANTFPQRGFDGIAFALTAESGYIVLDIDHCLDENGEIISEDVQTIVQIANTYTEISQSGTGLHLFFSGEKQYKRCKTDAGQPYEFYAKNRFIIMTGWLFGTQSQTINDDQEIIEQVENLIFPYGDETKRQKENRLMSESNTESIPVMLEDQKIIDLGMRERSPLFGDLFAGDISHYAYDDSRADLVLCLKIAFYTVDSAQIDRIFRQSSLVRPKWEEREDYRERTIQKALSIVVQHYRGSIRDCAFSSQEIDPKLALAQKRINDTMGNIVFSGQNGHVYLIHLNKKTGEEIPEDIANFMCWVTEQVVFESVTGTKRKYFMAGYADLNPLPRIEVMAEKFGTLDWVREKWGSRTWVGAGKGTMDTIRALINLVSIGSPEIVEKNHTGFEIIEGCERVYVTSQDVISADGVKEGVRTNLERGLKRYALSGEIPDLESIKEAVKASVSLLEIAPKNITYPIFAAVYLSVLDSIFEEAGYEPAFTEWVFRPDRIKKINTGRTLLKPFWKIYGEKATRGILRHSQ